MIEIGHFPMGPQSNVVEKMEPGRLKMEKLQVSEERSENLMRLGFSRDVVSLLKLGMSQYWASDDTRHRVNTNHYPRFPDKRRFLRYTLFCHIIAGWLVLTTLWIGG